jgi:hypothetical protein
MATIGDARDFTILGIVRAMSDEIVTLSREYEKVFNSDNLNPSLRETMLVYLSNRMRLEARTMVEKLGKFRSLANDV